MVETATFTAATVTVAFADLVGSATLVAVTVTLPAEDGAVRVADVPFATIVPPLVVHVTPVF